MLITYKGDDFYYMETAMAKSNKSNTNKNSRETLDNRIDRQKAEMIKELNDSRGNVSVACGAVSISRVTHYEWCKDDEEYKRDVDDIRESLFDFVESELRENIEDGKEASIFFFLKTQCKQRGYVEKQEIQQDVKLTKYEVESDG